MGPFTLFDKSAIQALSAKEVHWLNRYFSVVISPILMRELLSTLAKEPDPKYDWEKKLSELASKVDTFSSYNVAHSHSLARSCLLGGDVPLTGQIPMAGGKRMRAKDGTYGVFFDEPEEKAILRDWKAGNFKSSYKERASEIRSGDKSIDLNALKTYLKKNTDQFPKFSSLQDLADWLDNDWQNFFPAENHIKLLASRILDDSELPIALKRWHDAGKPPARAFSPYASYLFRCNLLYSLGLANDLIPSSKDSNSHLDIQYLHYAPFCMVFATSDKLLLKLAKHFLRPDQSLVDGASLKTDLQKIDRHFTEGLSTGENADRPRYADRPPAEASVLTRRDLWNRHFGKAKAVKDVPESERPIDGKGEKGPKRVISTFMGAVNVETNKSTHMNRKDEWGNAEIEARNNHFTDQVFSILDLAKHENWSEVKKKFSKDHVRKIYDLHADLWRPDHDYLMLGKRIREQKHLRGLYSGDVQPENAHQIWRWSLHFDQILVPDPFRTPWIHREEFNAIANPERFESDTLRSVFFLCLLEPLIRTGRVLLVQNPIDFDPKIRKAYDKVTQKKLDLKDGPQPTDAELKGAVEQRVRLEMRVKSRLPEDRLRKLLESETGSQNVDPHLRLLRKVRLHDPLCIDRDYEGKIDDIEITHRGLELESAVLMSALYGAVPFSDIPFRRAEFLPLGVAPTGVSSEVAKLLLNPGVTGFHFLCPSFSNAVFPKGALEEFRDLLMGMASCEGDEVLPSLNDLPELFAVIEEDCKAVADAYTKESGIESGGHLSKESMDILTNPRGMASAEALTLLRAHFPSLESEVQKAFIFVTAVPQPTLLDVVQGHGYQ